MSNIIFSSLGSDLSNFKTYHNKLHFTQSQKFDDGPYFIIIGTYSYEENAIKFIKKAIQHQKDISLFYNPKKQTFYVYAYQTSNKKEALDKLLSLREQAMFANAWLYIDKDSQGIIANSSGRIEKRDSFNGKSTDTDNTSQISINDDSNTDFAEPEQNETFKSSEISNVPANSDIVTNQSVEFSETPPSNEIDELEPADPEIVQKDEAPPKLVNEIEKIESASSGEFIVVNNFIFHPNAAILQESSQEDLDKLLSILLKNKNIRIRIHGHTNGEFRGEIVKMGRKDKEYFHLTSRNDYMKGDAKILSEERAKTIRNYLESNGISTGRIETRGWGAEQPIFPMESQNASLNSRVEIEIVQK